MVNNRQWKYLTPAVLCLSIGLAAPLWYSWRASGLSLLFAVGSFIYATIAINTDISNERRLKQKIQEQGGDPSELVTTTRKQKMAPLRFAAGAALCALCIIAPTLIRIAML